LGSSPVDPGRGGDRRDGPGFRGFASALALFAASFGYVEGAVVVYLREISYPGGFHFPLVAQPPRIFAAEIVREAATILLLLGVAFACAREGWRRFAVFAFCFGVWDLVYYATLKAILGWPLGWLEWDILFLVPVNWTGPVLAPVLVSVALVGASLLLLSLPRRAPCPLRGSDWWVEAGAGVAIVASFLWNSPAVAEGGVPASYPWWVFWCGYLAGVTLFVVRWTGRSQVSPEPHLTGLEPDC